MNKNYNYSILNKVDLFANYCGFRKGFSIIKKQPPIRFSTIIGLFLFFLLSSTMAFGQIAVTATSGTVGPTSYTTLKLAFDAVNLGTHQGIITINVTGNTTETLTAALNASGTGASNYSSITISPSGGSARTIAGAIVAGFPLINLNGADNVTFNGLNTGGNTLTFSNTTVSATAGTSTIRFIGDATNNTITNCTVSGSETTATSGTIFFSTGTVTGNDTNTISFCTLTAAGSNLPTNAIYAAGTSVAIDNSNNTVSNCNIQDYFNTTVSSTGILIASNATAWTLSGNKFFQTATRTFAVNGLIYMGIRIATASGGNYSITNNTIGFANSSGTGTSIFNGAFTSSFRGIELSGSAIVSSIQGNTISGISFTTSNGTVGTPGIFSGISVLSGAVNVGTVLGNTIGSATVASSIAITSSAATSSRIDGIYVASANTTSAIQNNTISGITTGGGATNGYSMVAIYTNGALGNFTISNNTIGSVTLANAIAMGTSGVTTTGVCSLYGIYNTATGTQTITSNTIRNTMIYGTGASFFYGIYNNGGIGLPIAINTNTIDGITNTGTSFIRGLYNSIAASSLTINNNIIRNLSVASATATVTGIQNAGAVTGTITIQANQLGDISGGLVTYTVANSATLSGIINSGGTAATSLSIQNNDIRGITHSVAGTGIHNYILNTAATFSQNISGNTFTNINVATSGNVNFITNNVALPALGSQLVSNNSIVGTFAKSVSGGTVTVFSSTATSVASATITNSGNNFSNITVTGATILTGWNQRDLGTTTKTIANNLFNNWVAGTGAITAMVLNGFGSTSTIASNTITNLIGQAAITGINIGTTGNATLLSVSSNTISGLSSTGTGGNMIAILQANTSTTVTITANAIATLSSTGVSSSVSGIQVSGGTGTTNVFGNTINTLIVTGATSPTVNGILVSGGTTINVYKNKLYDLAQNGASTGGNVNGIVLTGGANVAIYNNVVGDLKAPLVSNTHAIRGISINSAVANATYTVYFNTVAFSASSTGANFGTEALYHATNATATTANLLLKNNIFINNSVARGTGKTAACYRNNTTLTNYNSSSNNNLFYGGTPNTTNLIYFDGTNSSQTLAAFQTRVTPREIDSDTENVVFLSSVGSNVNFLNPDPTVPTYIESEGLSILGITQDYQNTIRQGNLGYLGSGIAPDMGAYEINGIVPVSPILVSGALVGNGTYSSLGSAFVALNSGAQTGADISIQVRNNTNEGITTAVLNAGAWNSIYIRPTGNRTITGATTAGNPLVDFNGADKVTIDGLNLSGNSLTISNTTASLTAGTSTIRFIADATNNTITNCTLLGSTQVPIGTVGGVVYFAKGTTTGNDTNTISACNIGPAGINLPSFLIYGNGTTTSAAIANSGITISNCNLYDYFLTTGCAAVYATTGNTDWSITNNKIYQSSSRTFTVAGSLYGIYFANATFGNNVQITSNTIGYANSTGSGTFALTGSSIAGNFFGIYFQGMPTAATACNLNSNTISDIALTSSTGTFQGIFNATGASSNTININLNTIKTIALNITTGTAFGINWASATNLSANGNMIYDITRDTAGNLYGMASTTNTAVNETVNNNTIFNLYCTSAAAGNVYGIFQNTATTGIKNFKNNTIYNLTGTAGTSIYGLTVSTGTTVDVSGNSITNLTSTNGINCSVVGISKSSVSTASIYKNKVSDLSSTATNPTLQGIFSSGAGSTTNIYNNLIGNLFATLANASNPVNGIFINAGTTANIYYNTVLLTGNSSGALFGSSALYVNTGVTVTLRNTILVNNTIASGAGLATAYRRSSSAIATYAAASNTNSFFGSSIFTDGTNNDVTLAAYKARVSTRDALSVAVNPVFLSTTGSNVQFLHINNAIPTGIEDGGLPIVGYTDDFDSNVRSLTVPDMGADEFNLLPTLTSFTPAAFCFSGGEVVTITGTNLNNGVVTVAFNGVLGTVTFQSPTSIVVTTPASITAGTIVVTTSIGFVTSLTPYTVAPVSVAGTVSANQAICSISIPADISVTGSVGAIQWQKSPDSITFSDIPGSTAALLSGASIGTLSTTTYFRAVVTSGVCSAVNSSVVVVTIGSTTWTSAGGGSWTNGAPTSLTDATISYAYNSTGNLSACKLTVNSGAVVTILSGHNVDLQGALTVTGVGSNFILQNNANLIQSSDVANSGNITVNRYGSSLYRLDYTLWSSPVVNSGLFLQAFSPSTLSNRFYTYDSTSDLYAVVANPATTSFTSGIGYLIRMRNNAPVAPALPESPLGVFTGLPTNGPVTLNGLTSGLYYGIGNPYPSTMDADTFIIDNGLSEALYFWRKTNAAAGMTYATYTLLGGVSANLGDPTPNGIIQVGQGFIANASSDSFIFTNAMRVANNSNQFFRTTATNKSRIWLNLTSNNGFFSQAMVAYVSNATNGVDAGIDGKYINDSQTALTSIIANKEYAIQGRALPFITSDVVPLGFKSQLAGTYTIALNSFDGLFDGEQQAIFLKDKTTNTITNLRATSYTFATEPGIFNLRFEIVYENALGMTQPLFTSNSVVVYNNKQELVINTGSVAMATVQIFDIQGRLLVNKKHIDSFETKIAMDISNEVILVKIIAADGSVVTKKVVN